MILADTLKGVVNAFLTFTLLWSYPLVVAIIHHDVVCLFVFYNIGTLNNHRYLIIWDYLLQTAYTSSNTVIIPLAFNRILIFYALYYFLVNAPSNNNNDKLFK